MKQYVELLSKIISEGIEKKDRTGTGTKSIFGHQMRFNMSDGFPLLTLKKTHFKSIAHELLWFLKGETNIKYLRENGVTIWDEWADDDGELGPVYGSQWVNWLGYGEGIQAGHMDGFGNFNFKPKGINQIANAISQLKNDPDSRRIMVSAWNVSELPKMKLPPCHYSFQLYSEECFDNSISKRKLSLLWNQRSVDSFLGLPFNISSYALLLHMIAQCVDMVPHELISNLGDTHLYLNHMEQENELLKRWNDAGQTAPAFPTIKLNPEIKDIFAFKYDDIMLEGYNPLASIKAPIAI